MNIKIKKQIDILLLFGHFYNQKFKIILFIFCSILLGFITFQFLNHERYNYFFKFNDISNNIKLLNLENIIAKHCEITFEKRDEIRTQNNNAKDKASTYAVCTKLNLREFFKNSLFYELTSTKNFRDYINKNYTNKKVFNSFHFDESNKKKFITFDKDTSIVVLNIQTNLKDVGIDEAKLFQNYYSYVLDLVRNEIYNEVKNSILVSDIFTNKKKIFEDPLTNNLEKIINLMLEFDNSTETVSGIKINSIDLSNFLITILFVSVIFSFTIIFFNFIIIKK